MSIWISTLNAAFTLLIDIFFLANGLPDRTHILQVSFTSSIAWFSSEVRISAVLHRCLTSCTLACVNRWISSANYLGVLDSWSETLHINDDIVVFGMVTNSILSLDNLDYPFWTICMLGTSEV